MRGIVFAHDPYEVPPRLRARFDEIVALTDALAARHLDAEYADLCRRMAAAFARRQRSPLERGKARSWAAGIVYAVGWVNFLGDPSQQPHMTTAELAGAAGVGESTVAAMFRQIRAHLDLVRFDPAWTRPSKMLDNPLAWMVLVDGTPVDLRQAPRAIQEEAFRQGLIPFVPEPNGRMDERPAVEGWGGEPSPPAGGSSAARDVTAEMEAVLERALAAHPDATEDELNAILEEAAGRYNSRGQAELGGLSPLDVDALITADWEGPESAIRLDGSVTPNELAGAITFQNARLVLELLGERAPVKATPKGNLPRTFVEAFRKRMRRPPAHRAEPWDEPKVVNEQDYMPLHVVRVLLEAAALVRRTKGAFVRTRRGDRLAAAERSGELFVTLLRTHFRRFNLAYLDGVGPAPELQQTIGYTFFQFGRAGAEWRKPAELENALLLPGIRDALPEREYYDVAALVLETRFLRPLEGLGLAASRPTPREPDELTARVAYRKTPLFDRVVSFRLTAGGGAMRADADGGTGRP